MEGRAECPGGLKTRAYGVPVCDLRWLFPLSTGFSLCIKEDQSDLSEKIKSGFPFSQPQEKVEDQATNFSAKSLQHPPSTRTLKRLLSIFSDLGESSEETMLTPSQALEVAS